MGILANIANVILPGLMSTIDKWVPDPTLAAKLKQQLQIAFLQADEAEVAAAAEVVTTEAKSEHWLTSTWRPITMLVFVAIVANNYLVAPYLQQIFHWSVMLVTPPDLWELIKIGLGGYVLGRSAEKVAGNVALALKGDK